MTTPSALTAIPARTHGALRVTSAARHWWPVAAIVAIGLAATGIAFHFADQVEDQRIHSALEFRVDWQTKDLEQKIDAARETFITTAVFVSSQDVLDIEEFRRFTSRANRAGRPIAAVDWLPRVTRDQRTEFERQVSAARSEKFQILERVANAQLGPAAERDEYFPILAQTRFEEFPSVEGFDVASDPTRAAIQAWARDAGRPRATLATQGLIGQVATYLAFWPIYAGAVTPVTVDERRARLRGFVLGVFRVPAVLTAAIVDSPEIVETINFYLADDRTAAQPGEITGKLVATYSPDTKQIIPGSTTAAVSSATHRFMRSFTIMGQRWEIEFLFSPQIASAARSNGPLAILLAGFLLTGALAAYVARERRQRATIEIVVDQRTVELTQANQALKTSEAETQRQAQILQEAVDALADGFVLYDREDRITLCNRRYREIRGHDMTDQVEGRHFEDNLRASIAHGRIEIPANEVEAWIRRRVEQHRNPAGPVVTRIGDRWMRVSERKSGNGGIVAIHTDITELRQAQADAEAARARMADWAGASADCVWESDANHRLTFVSDSFEKTTGLKAENRLGQPRFDSLPSADPDNTAWQAHLEDQATHRPFRDFVAPLGKKHLRLNATPVFDSGGFVGYRGTTRDITEEVEAERLLARQTEIFTTLIENLPIGVSLIGSDLRFVAFNHVFLDVFDLTPEMIKVGDLFEKLIRYGAERGEYGTGDIEAMVSDRVAQAIVPRPYQFERKRPGGQVLEVRRVPLRGGGFVTTYTDVTKERKAEQQLAQAQKIEAVGQLSGGIAHEFNNLLGIVVGNLDMQAGLLKDALATELNSEALGAALRGSALVERLLAFSRSQPLQPTQLDLGEIVRGVEPLLSRSLGENIVIEIKIAADLWPVTADRTQFENAVVSLALNARDAMPRGGLLSIECTNMVLDTDAGTLRDLSAGEFVTISVRDNGTGIAADVLPHVFEPFFTTKDVDQGSGLGLSSVQGYARQSGGAVTIYSELGHGTEVRVYLPRMRPSVATVTSDTSQEASMNTSNEKILVVEDKEEVRRMAVRLLENLGYRTVAVENAAAALQALEGGATFDLLFTDIMMAGELNGIGLAKEVRRRFPSMPVVFTSGFSNPETTHTDIAALGATIVGKPYRLTVLAEQVRDALTSRKGIA